MIKHIVCFKLKDNSLEECEKARDILKSMEGNVPLLRGIDKHTIKKQRNENPTANNPILRFLAIVMGTSWIFS